MHACPSVQEPGFGLSIRYRLPMRHPTDKVSAESPARDSSYTSTPVAADLPLLNIFEKSERPARDPFSRANSPRQKPGKKPSLRRGARAQLVAWRSSRLPKCERQIHSDRHASRQLRRHAGELGNIIPARQRGVEVALKHA